MPAWDPPPAVPDALRAIDGAASSALSDARLRRLFEANVVGIVISNNAGALLEVNDAFLDMLGYSRADFEQGMLDWRKLTPPEWIYLDERAIAQMATDGVFAPYEKEYVRKDGVRLPISVGGARIAGTVDEQICYIVDLSNVRRAEAALRRSESRFRRLTDANVIGIITTRLGDDDGIIEANDAFLRMVGYTREEFEAGLIRRSALTPREFKDASDRAKAALPLAGRFAPFEKEYVRKDGVRVPALVGGALVEGSDREVVCYVLDLTEQKAADIQLRESERRYRLLAESLPQIVMLADEDRRLAYVNRRYEEYTGIRSDELPSRWREAIHPDDLPAVDAARATGEPYEIEYRLRRAADGAYRWHFARCQKMPADASGVRWLAAAIDIDDRKRAEDALRFMEKAGSRLSQSLDLETTFETLLDLVVPEFGDWASINLCDDEGHIKTIAARHRDPHKADLARRLRGAKYYNESHDLGTPSVYRTGVPFLQSQIGRDDLAATVKEAYADIIAEMGFGSLVALPIVAQEEVIGSISIVSAGERRRYDRADLPPLEELARRAGFAIQNARLYEREHRVANLLQEAALPTKLPSVRGFAFDGFYRAGRREASIGGDWFDAHVASDGRVVISVGDVAGSGLQAAVLMSNLRQVIRGAAYVYADPMMILEVADRALLSEHEHGMATAFVGVIDPVRKTMLYASAGHLPALLRHADGAIDELSAPGLPLGCRDLGASESRTVILPPGSSLLLYTDGLVEWAREVLAGQAILRRRFAEMEPNGTALRGRWLNACFRRRARSTTSRC